VLDVPKDQHFVRLHPKRRVQQPLFHLFSFLVWTGSKQSKPIRETQVQIADNEEPPARRRDRDGGSLPRDRFYLQTELLGAVNINK